MAETTSKVPPRPGGKKGARAAGGPPRRPHQKRSSKRPGRNPARRYAYLAAAVVAAALIVLVVVLATSGSSAPDRAANYKLADGTKVYGGLGPEHIPMELGPVLAGAAATPLTGAPVDGVACNGSEQTVVHYHTHLAIFINGKPYSMPLGVGMQPTVQVEQTPAGNFAASSPCFYYLHTHAQDGIVHIEAPVNRPFALGQVFDLWHVPLSPNQIGTFNGPVTATVGGQPYSGDPASIVLASHEQIVLNLGTPVVQPPPINWSGSNL